MAPSKRGKGTPNATTAYTGCMGDNNIPDTGNVNACIKKNLITIKSNKQRKQTIKPKKDSWTKQAVGIMIIVFGCEFIARLFKSSRIKQKLN